MREVGGVGVCPHARARGAAGSSRRLRRRALRDGHPRRHPLVWDEVPDALGWSEPAWWYVVLVPALAGVLVAAAIRLPGHGGHVPLVRSTAFPDVLSAASSMRSNATALMSTPGPKAMTSPTVRTWTR